MSELKRFETMDLIIPQIEFDEDGVYLCVELTDTHVCLQVGPRDMRWSRKTGRITDAGTALAREVPEVPNE